MLLSGLTSPTEVKGSAATKTDYHERIELAIKMATEELYGTKRRIALWKFF